MAQETAVQSIEELAPTLRCPHHWVIQPADGLVSAGVCQLCGEAREFQNYIEAGPWGDSRRHVRNSRSDVEEIAIAVSLGMDDEEE